MKLVGNTEGMFKRTFMKKIFLKDYIAPSFTVHSIELYFNIKDNGCEVSAKMDIQKTDHSVSELVLDGEELSLISVQLNGLKPRYDVTETSLKVFDVPDQFILNTTVFIDPENDIRHLLKSFW